MIGKKLLKWSRRSKEVEKGKAMTTEIPVLSQEKLL
jgi:hypothetical protein